MEDLVDVLNWRRIDGRVTTSGQPTEAQLAAIAGLGVQTVINLGPHDNKGALEDEPGTVAGLGMEYVYIPVDFDAPTRADYAAFCAAMDGTDQPVHVHCIYNARVSAFFYLYLQEKRGVPRAEALALMDGIWRPGGVWADLIGDADSVGLDNRYKGYDY